METRLGPVVFVGAFFSFAVCASTMAAPLINESRSVAQDLGATVSVEGDLLMSVTVSLNLHDADQMLSRLEATYTEGSAQFHQFLSREQFAAQFGPTPQTVTQVTDHFQAAGFEVERTSLAHLRVTGRAAAMESEFGVGLHTYEIPATQGASAFRFRAPIASLQLSPDIAGSVRGVVGLDTRPRYRPNMVRSASLADGRVPTVTSSASTTGNPPGAYTVQDFAQFYDVDPLYQHGLTGRGTTVGIVMVASFTPSDAFAYWSSLGLEVSPYRIKEVQIDGGSGPPSDLSGSFETTLDVEQAGGIAPGARILVYETPNTSQGFVDAFAAAIDSNEADTISCSAGAWEYFDQLDTAAGGAVIDPQNGQPSTVFSVLDDLFAQAALQGQSMYQASDDSGAYLSELYYFPPSWPLLPGSVVLSVSDPASQRWATAVGGTTLPGTQVYPISATQSFTVTIEAEQAWGTDYLIPFCAELGLDPLSCGIFSSGSGGGVSAYAPMPFYQKGIPGMKRTAAGQTLLDYSQTPPALVVSLPSGFLGRNVPDISLNSDPATGYVLFYTSSSFGFGVFTGDGGTSFAAPQFNGVTALFDEVFGRVGLLNPALYGLVRRGVAYRGEHAPLRDITAGDNWFYRGRPGYDNATGLGVPDFWNLFQALMPLYRH